MNPDRNVFSKSRLAFCMILAVLGSSVAMGQLVNLRLMSSAYGWKQYDTVGTSKKFWRGFQSVMLDVGQGDFSLHGHIQGAVMLKKKLDELPDYRLFYGYAQWKDIGKAMDISVGRLPFFVGVGAGTIDGALTKLRLADNVLRMTFYGGANTPLDLTVKKWGPLNRDFTVGGQAVLTVEDFRFGGSYMNRQRQRPAYYAIRPDSLFNPATVYVDPEQTREQYAGVDFSYWMTKATFYTRYDYNVDYKQTQRAQVSLHYYPSSEWGLSVDYMHRAPRLPYNSFFSVFAIPTSDELEGGVDYTVVSSTRIFLRGAMVKYIDNQSFRYTIGVANEYASVSYRRNRGYAGELDAVSAQGASPLLGRRLIPTLGVSYSSYKLIASDKTDNAFAATAGVIARPLQLLSIDVQGQYITNKIYKNDVRLYAGLTFWISHNLNLFE